VGRCGGVDALDERVDLTGLDGDDVAGHARWAGVACRL